jgi:hypothetical protein
MNTGRIHSIVTKLLVIIFLISTINAFAVELEKFAINTKTAHNSSLTFWFRVPKSYKKDSGGQYRIMVLFGGRNWTGNKTINTYRFNDLADKYKLILLSPSFKDDEYWHPEKWSGKTLLDAVAKVRLKYNLSAKKRILYYGYSAGGQCVSLFLFWKPKIVKAWGLHACGVWADAGMYNVKKITAPGLVTCGEEDDVRMLLSCNFIYNARENGMKIIWRSYPGGHDIQRAALQLAKSFFAATLSNDDKVKYVGDDQAMDFFSVRSLRGKNIEKEYKNEFSDLKTAKLWKK